MKTDINGVSQCPKGTEHYETFTAMGRGDNVEPYFFNTIIEPRTARCLLV